MGETFYKFLALAAAAACTAAPLAGSGYLALVGPKPLRFAAVKVRGESAPVLPPLSMTDRAPTNSPTADEPFGPQPLAGVVFSQTNALEQLPALPQPDSAPKRQVTPDTLLQFFTPGAQGGAVISTPVEFSPPAAGPARSSTATYISE